MHKTIIIAAAGVMLCGCAHQDDKGTSATWQVVENGDGFYTHRITLKGDLDFQKLGFNCFARQMTPVNELDTITEVVPGYYVISSGRFDKDADSLVIDINTRGSYRNRAYSLDGLHRILSDGTTAPIALTRIPVTERKQWATPDGVDRMPYGPEIYDRNEEIYSEEVPSPYAVVPSYKQVRLTQGTSKTPLAYRWINPANTNHYDVAYNPEYYTLTVRDDSLIITAADERVANAARYSFEKLVADNYDTLPNVEITDWPDLAYRGLMIDISRNFQSPEAMKHFIDLMAQYRMNTLHFHLLDDEAWRLEIKQLPELTEVGARRGYTTDEHDFLVQIFSGDGNPDTQGTTSNGYYTREQFIDFIKYAYDRGIAVIPEIESPGHARAAVKSMEARYRRTGDDSLRLIHDGDTSKYTSAQAFHDCVMNPALEGPYRFMDIVMTEIQSMYQDAGVPLPAIHIGGDEVARGAWNGSEVAQKFIEEHKLDGQTGLHGYFVDRVIDMARAKGIKISGWQEIALGHSVEYNASTAPEVYSVNCWTEASGPNPVGAQSVKNGYPTILSNVNYFYMDMMYNNHPEEYGLNWGGTVDEFQSLHGYPARLCPVDVSKEKGSIKGVSGHLFAETIRNPEMVEYFLFPKMLGLVERAWNNDSTYTDRDFNAVVGLKEIPRWAKEGRNFHLRQAGIKEIDGKIYMNSPYPGAEIRYTTDGTEPTASSALYSEPLPAEGLTEVRARLFYNGKESLTTYLFFD